MAGDSGGGGGGCAGGSNNATSAVSIASLHHHHHHHHHHQGGGGAEEVMMAVDDEDGSLPLFQNGGAAAAAVVAAAAAGSSSSSSSCSSSKRPRNMKQVQTYNPGDRVDAMDLEGVWHEGVVKEVDVVQGYRVHFLGWSSRWDEWVEVASERIQSPYSKVRNWRPALRVGDPVEVRSAMYQDRWLSGVVVAVCPDDGLVKCEYSHDSRWIETSGEEICLPNTHFSRELDNMAPQKIEQIFREGEIHLDCRAGNAENVQRLIEQDNSLVHLKGPLERTPLLIASDNCHLNVIRILLAAGAALQDIDRSNANCLHLAVRGHRERCPEVVQALATAGAMVSARDSRLSTPLHLVAMRGYFDVGLTLIQHGADVNAKDMSQVTPLRHAAYRGEESIVRLLLHYGADPTIPDAQGGKPLDVACYLRNRPKRHVVEQLLRDGHIGYLLKKMREIIMWECGFDLDKERRCHGVHWRRQQEALPPPRVELHPPSFYPSTQLWCAASAPAPAAAVSASPAFSCLSSSSFFSSPFRGDCPPSLQDSFQVAQHVLLDLNQDMFLELTEYFT